jgi:hypothetical protein
MNGEAASRMLLGDEGDRIHGRPPIDPINSMEIDKTLSRKSAGAEL